MAVSKENPSSAVPSSDTASLCTLLQIENLDVHFGSEKAPQRAVDGISLAIADGQTVALVGESGCGKTVTALSVARLAPCPPGRYAGGRIVFAGEDVLQMSARRLRTLRGGQVAYVFQEPGAALNPVMRVGRQIAESVRLHNPGVDARAETERLLAMVGLPDPGRRLHAYPHELSGGMQQRVVIAMALASHPRLLIADEPTTALDVTIQAQIMDLLRDLQQTVHMAILLISHNLGLVAELAHDVHVMYAGRIVESGPAEAVLRDPAHPYTRGLLDAVPRLTRGAGRAEGIPGTVPHPGNLPTGCRFHPRCPYAQELCTHTDPAGTAPAEGRGVYCHFPLGGRA